MRKKIPVLTLCLVLAAALQAGNVRIRLLSDMTVSQAMLSLSANAFTLYGDGNAVAFNDTLAVFQLQQVNDSILVKTPGDTLGTFKQLLLQPRDEAGNFKLKPITPLSGTRRYFGSLELIISGGKMCFINEVDLEYYVAGVVESESGGYRAKEFYKVQAILCRTYGLNHLGRHVQEGYELCDGTHCQVYRRVPADQQILDAVKETSGLVLVDGQLNLITAAFHSNCGGQTVNSEDVWASSVPYLRSVQDTFCCKMQQAKWQRKIPSEDWFGYLQAKHKFPVNDTNAVNKATHFKQNGRQVYYCDRSYYVPLRTLRTDWQLKSTYFNVEQLGSDTLLITGRGWGHGVGLCQEGAIQMAKRGYTYEQILAFYYRGVSLVPMSRLAFFREE